ncbi:MAG TPA: peptidase U62 [Kosmotogaceae bacterium]|nr:MAG: Peptidase U62 modulator of DNA gyrase [Thermotogales bacterium 46_20]HAA85807.1 peptidase U62 [Kosmotogaceae bacterium]
MDKETYSIEVNQTCLNVVQTRIDSIRSKKIRRTGLRMVNEGKIGVAGTLGEANEERLESRARDSLELGIPYPYELTTGIQEQRSLASDIRSAEQLISEAEALLGELRQRQSVFSFGNKIILTERSVTLNNTRDTLLVDTTSFIEILLVIKHKKSANIMDAFTGYNGVRYDKEEFLRLTDSICNAYLNEIRDFEDGRYPVVFLPDSSHVMKFYDSLHGMLYGSGGSLLSGKIGEKLFADSFTLYSTRNNEDGVFRTFFDTEGTVNKDFRFPLIENGVLRSPYTNKKASSMFGIPLTGEAGGDYDSVPNIDMPSFRISQSEKTIGELLGGRKAVFAFIADGGDFTSDGSFASPVQFPILFDGEHFVGRLPELSISSQFFRMFGEDFIGVGKDSLTTLAPMNLTAINMDVRKT